MAGPDEAAMTQPALDRLIFTTSRLAEFSSEKELINQTGHDSDDWPLVILKELIDNALDAAEGAALRQTSGSTFQTTESPSPTTAPESRLRRLRAFSTIRLAHQAVRPIAARREARRATP
jgi:hypothetical protein